MKYLLALLLSLVAFVATAQTDSLMGSGTYKVDTVFVADTTYVIDTIIVIDTLVVPSEREERDTLFLSSDQQSWSLVAAEVNDEKKELILRKDSGMWLATAKISFSDTQDDTNWKGYSISSLPPLALQLEYFHNDYFSYGGQLLYSRNKYSNDTLASNYIKNSVLGVAAIGTFHYGSWLQDVTHNWFKFGYLDLYTSMALRFDVHRDVEGGAWNEDLQQFESDVKHKEAEVKMKIRPIFGARYYISDRFSINIELGEGNLGMLSSSVSWLINP